MDDERSFVAAASGLVVDAGPEATAPPQRQCDEASDEVLINALAVRTDWAIGILYQRYSGQLYSLAYRMVGNHAVAEDLLQEVFLSIWRNATSYTPHAGSARNWLFSIMHHRAIDYLRYKRRHSPNQETVLEEAERSEEAATPDVWDDTWRTIQASIIRECLTLLPREQRAIIELVYFHGWTQAEIAAKFSIPLGTIKSRIRLGLLHLRKELEQRGILNE
ncbi:MAG TPA: sigma-70 family RNA polymerase sigma factor [Ktedonobacteraceae bacterium]|nr:sigma-70 family RNA polymerase sigma factor [Ktedonobacteraceae bacterium]